jgi:hypothetical protein
MRSRDSRLHHPLTAPITDSLGHMRAKDVSATSKISNSPRDAQNPMHRTRRELQQVDRVLQHRLIIRRKPTHRIRFRLIKMRIAASSALPLDFARTDHTRTNHIAALTRRRIRTQFRRRQSRHFHMQIDAFEQRA